jgi:acyl-CoA synthetase (AMP-forming)/AMP-acid ligase II/acyl carrier protein
LTWVDLLRARAAAEADRVGYRFLADGESAESTLTYGRLDRRARAVAATLRSLGVGAGDRVLVLCPPGLAFVEALLGVMCAGAVAVPAHPPRAARRERSASSRLTGILHDSAPAAALMAAAQAEVVGDAIRDAGRGVALVAVDSIADAAADGWSDPSVSPTDLALLQYTSGSTGDPRGVELTHANLLHNSATIRDAFGHTRDSAGVIWLPPQHDMGLIGGVLQPLFVGFPVTLMPAQAFLARPVRWLRAISKYGATTSGGPNFAYDLCARTITDADKARLDLSRWAVAFNGAEPIDADTLDRFARAFAPCGFDAAAFYPCYGLAEATLLVTGPAKGGGAARVAVDPAALREHRVAVASNGAVAAARTLVGSGRAASDHAVVIVDPTTATRCGGDRVGEIWVRGGAVARGYWNRPAETTETFDARLADDAGPYLRTGDLGFVRGGELFVTGRLKDVIIVRGQNHYPHDLERTVERCHAALRPAGGVVVLIDHGAGGERVAVIHEVEREHRRAAHDPIIAAIREAVAREHGIAPHVVVLLEPGGLPRTSSGKPRRGACRDALAAGTLPILERWTGAEAPLAAPQWAPEPAADRAAAGCVVEWLRQRLAATLGVDVGQIDPAEPFARYGLDSASAVGLAGEIEMATGRDLPATLFWDYPTIDALARHLRDECGMPAAPATSAAPAGGAA